MKNAIRFQINSTVMFALFVYVRKFRVVACEKKLYIFILRTTLNTIVKETVLHYIVWLHDSRLKVEFWKNEKYIFML